jgi:hypothetical protein
MRKRASTVTASTTTKVDLSKILRILTERCSDPAQLLEILYWYEEAELATVMRQFVALPVATRNAMRAFLVMTKDDASSVKVSFTSAGMTLSSPMIAEYVRTMGCQKPAQPPNGSLH